MLTIDIVELRKALGLNQTEFWAPLGVKQSTGSRYEKGRPIPYAIRSLIRVVYLPSANAPGSTPMVSEREVRRPTLSQGHEMELILSYLATHDLLRAFILSEAMVTSAGSRSRSKRSVSR